MRVTMLTNGGRQDVLLEQLAEAKAACEGIVWVDVHHPTAKGMARVQEVFNLHPLAVEDTLNQSQ